ncbi:MAG: aldose 1-epimerase family protein [Sphaerochaeta sp.]|jgi:galactose mutarotase-like enzyme|nr:aldose 1-epimerase family protein [Sphaerochaeta sp.]
MIISLASARYAVAIDTMGAELKRFADTIDSVSYLFNGDPQWWAGTAPVLFPIIGGLASGSFIHEGISYQLGSHGFARKSEFTVVSCDSTHAVLTLQANDQTKAVYPFDFRLTVSVVLEWAGLAVRYDVENLDSQVMYFSIGSHPAFALPLGGGYYEHHFLEFEYPERDERWFFGDGCLLDHSESAFDAGRLINLRADLFDRGPLIFRDVDSRAITLRRSRGHEAITIRYDAPNVAIWSKAGRAPFVCIEPWWGLPDPCGFSGTLSEKPGIISLSSHATFTTRYSLEVR